MEQYSTQQPIVIEQAPEQTKKPVGLQVAALIIGVIGLAFAFFAYFGTIIANVGAGVAASEQSAAAQGFAAASGVTVVVDVIIAVVCLIGLILGIAGLVKSIRRATRTVGGIVMSAIGITMSEGGLVLAVIAMIISGVFQVLIRSGVFR